MGKLVHLSKPVCPSCTEETVCVACYLDEKHVESLEDDRVVLDLEGYGLAD